MRERSRGLRDRVVWVLARLSLAVVLAFMGALFMGSTQPSAYAGQESATVEPVVRGSLLEGANPVGVALGAAVILAGLVVLAVAALRPSRRLESHELVALLQK